MSFFPQDPKKLKSRIRSYERKLSEPHHDDGAGKRFLLAPMYQILGDNEAALRSYEWYEKHFPDDIAEAFHSLSWALCLFQVGDLPCAKKRLRRTLFSNLYVIPLLLGQEIEPYSFWHGSNWAEKSYITEGPFEEFFSLWDAPALEWAKSFYHSAEIQTALARWIELRKALGEEQSMDKRIALIEEENVIATGEPKQVPQEVISISRAREKRRFSDH